MSTVLICASTESNIEQLWVLAWTARAVPCFDLHLDHNADLSCQNNSTRQPRDVHELGSKEMSLQAYIRPKP